MKWGIRMTRQQIIEQYRSQPDVSVLIVGAGVNGIGTFRDLALQGVDVLIVDKGDYCSGASAGSSHMLHGGIRYLENGEFRLVKEALTERNRLLKSVPHAAKPLPTTIPIYGMFSGIFNAPLKFLRLRDKPSERGAFIIKVGLVMYDWFTRGQQGLPGHRLISRAESLKLRPKLDPNILCTATYFDAWMPSPERICVEVLRDGQDAQAHAHALNYVRLARAEGERVTLVDEVTGEAFDVKPKVVINAAGPWIDFANNAIGQKTRFIGGTKGSHLIVDHPELHQACAGHEIFFETKDGRICLIFPLMDKVILGTTDIRVDDPETALCTEDEIDYILNLVGQVFPALTVDRSHIVFQFCGVRPLPASDSATAGQISRDHSIRTVEAGDGIAFPVLSLVGGKWTTFRAFAEQAADAVLARLGREREVDTTIRAFGGGVNYPASEAEQTAWIARVAIATGLPDTRIRLLFERYGTRAEAIAQYCAAAPDSALRTLPEYSRRELAYLALHEDVVHLDDLLLRRTLISMLGLTTVDVLRETAQILQDALGWSAELTQREIERAARIHQERHGMTHLVVEASGTTV